MPPPLQTGTSRRGPRSLRRMALAVAVRNIGSITDLGDMSFADARPLLLHIENPHQLHALETQCEQLAAEPRQMAEIWKRLLAKKVPDWEKQDYLGQMGYSKAEQAGEEEEEEEEEKKVEEREGDEEDREGRDGGKMKPPIPWYEVYCTIKAAIDRDVAAATARLQQTLAGFTKAKETNATQLVTGWQANRRALVKKIPGVGVGVRRRGAAGASLPSTLGFAGGSRTKLTSGQSVLRRARREAREINKVSQLSTPTGHLAVARNQIRKPPPAMLHDHRVAQQPEIVPEVVIHAPGRRRSTVSVSGSMLGSGGSTAVAGTGLGRGNAANEARLLALKEGKSPSSSLSAAVVATPRGEKRLAAPASPVDHHKKADKTDKKEDNSSTRRTRKGEPDKGDDLGGHDGDDDDDLFGDNLIDEKPAKRRRLTVVDLEQTTTTTSGGDSSTAVQRQRAMPGKPLFPATTTINRSHRPAAAPTLLRASSPPKKKPLLSVRPAATKAPTAKLPAVAAAETAAPDQLTRKTFPEASYVARPARKRPSPAPALPPAPRPSPRVLHKKPVDIFMKQKKR